MNASYDYSDKVVLVTGGVSGIGGATSRAFARAGARVIATGLTDAELAAARADTELGQQRIEPLDVSDAAAVTNLIGSLERLDVVVNCAGMIRREAEFDPAVFDQVMDVNVSGGMRVSTAARPLLARSKGSIVFIASMLTFFGGPKQPAYAASKGAVKQLTMSLAGAYAVDGIRVNAVAPGWILTPLSKGAHDDAARNASIVSRTPMARWGDPAEVADPILFLCSDAARFVTGVVLPVDGGFLTA